MQCVCIIIHKCLQIHVLNIVRDLVVHVALKYHVFSSLCRAVPQLGLRNML